MTRNYLIKFGDLWVQAAYGCTYLVTEERPKHGYFSFDEATLLIATLRKPERFTIENVFIGHPQIID